MTQLYFSASLSSPKPCLCTHSELFTLLLLSEKAALTQNIVFSICLCTVDAYGRNIVCVWCLKTTAHQVPFLFYPPHLPSSGHRSARGSFAERREGERANPLPRHLLSDFPAHQLEEYESGRCSSPIDGLIKAVGRVTLRESHLAN